MNEYIKPEESRIQGAFPVMEAIIRDMCMQGYWLVAGTNKIRGQGSLVPKPASVFCSFVMVTRKTQHKTGRS